MILKRPVCPERIRKPPAGFSWLDHRLVRDGYIDRCSHQAAALYLFLVTVADARGLSYYSDASLMKRLSMDSSALHQARRNLVHLRLIAYQKPLYQVLALDSSPVSVNKITATRPLDSRFGGRQSPAGGCYPLKRAFQRPQSIKEILKQLMEDKT